MLQRFWSKICLAEPNRIVINMNVELEQRLIEKIRQMPIQRILEVEDFIDFLNHRDRQSSPSLTQAAIDRRAFMKLPMAERQRILAAQAEAISEHYEQDVEWQEWVNLDIEAIYDES